MSSIKTEKTKKAKILPVIIYPNPILRRLSEEILLTELKEPEFQQLLLDIEETMLKKDGAGLAAPQIGKNIRLFVLALEKKTLFCLNPQITKRSWAKAVEEEGCLSVLNKKGEIIYAPVERCRRVNFMYWDEKGEKKKIAATDMLARVIQHELDHLDGVLFIDKIVAAEK